MPVFSSAVQAARVLVLAAAVCLAGWWTWFLNGKLDAGERELREREAEIARLEEGVERREAQISSLRSDVAERDARIREQERVIAEKEEEIRALDAALRLLKVDRRLAEIEVLEQEVSRVSSGARGESGDGDGEGRERGGVRTRVRFTELSPEGEPLGEPLEAVVEGRTVYVETLVIKFEDRFVEEGDALRGSSVCLFRRLFGEDQKPSDGVPIDAVGVRPVVYGGDDVPDPTVRELWSRFWDWAHDPEAARARGVRAIHGEAPFIELRPGKRYRIELRASGGLTIRTLP